MLGVFTCGFHFGWSLFGNVYVLLVFGLCSACVLLSCVLRSACRLFVWLDVCLLVCLFVGWLFVERRLKRIVLVV